jgi:hypothetical protein
MLIRNYLTVPPPHAVNPPPQPPTLTLQVESQPLVLVLLPLQLHVQTPARIHPLIRHAHLLHLFEIEEAFAVCEGMK